MPNPTPDTYVGTPGTVISGGRFSDPALFSDYERASLNAGASSLVGNVITAAPLQTEGESRSGWREFGFGIDWARGRTFQFYIPLAGNDTNQWPSQSPNRKPMGTYDMENFWYLPNCTINSTLQRLEFHNTTPFEQDTVYITRGRQMPVHKAGKKLAELAAAYPSLVAPAPSAVAFTPSGTLPVDARFGPYVAQEFIAGEFDEQTDDVGVVEPKTPFYAAVISDASLSNPRGGAKRKIWICGGVHASEDYGDHLMMRFIEHWLGSSTEALYMRARYDMIWHPCMNAPGRAGGATGGAFQDVSGGRDDLNRNFHLTLPTGLQIVDIPKAALLIDLDGAVPLIHLAYHAPYGGQWGYGVDGVANTETFRARTQTFFGKTVSDNDSTPVGSTVYWANLQGASLAIHIESGDPVNMLETDMTNFSVSGVQALADMDADGSIHT